MSRYSNISGIWRESTPKVNINGVWHEVDNGFSNANGVWKSEFARVIPVTGITLNQTSITLTEGDTYQLVATVYPANATNKTVTWSSSNGTLVSISSGLVTGLKAGNAIVTVSAGGHTTQCSIFVKLQQFPSNFQVTGFDKLLVPLTTSMYNDLLKGRGYVNVSSIGMKLDGKSVKTADYKVTADRSDVTFVDSIPGVNHKSTSTGAYWCITDYIGDLNITVTYLPTHTSVTRQIKIAVSATDYGKSFNRKNVYISSDFLTWDSKRQSGVVMGVSYYKDTSASASDLENTVKVTFPKAVTLAEAKLKIMAQELRSYDYTRGIECKVFFSGGSKNNEIENICLKTWYEDKGGEYPYEYNSVESTDTRAYTEWYVTIGMRLNGNRSDHRSAYEALLKCDYPGLEF